MASRSFFIFLLVLLFVLSLSIILFELALTRIFSIVLWYDYAFMAISEKISKLYFVDLVGAALATIILDPIMQSLGAGPTLLLTSVVVVGASVCSYFFVLTRATRGRRDVETSYYHSAPSAEIERKEVVVKPRNRLNVLSAITFSGLTILLIVNSISSVNIFEIKPGISKGLYYQLNHPSEFQHLSEEWNSFSRVDVTRKIAKQEEDKNTPSSTPPTASSKRNDNNSSTSDGSSNSGVTAAADMDNATAHELASIIIDA